MELECPVCSHREDYGEVGESATCTRCGAVIDPLAATVQSAMPAELVRAGERPGGLKTQPWGAGSFLADMAPRSRDPGDGAAPPRTGEFIPRPVVFAALAALEGQLEPGWGALLDAEQYVTLRSQLARVHRLGGQATVAEAGRLVERLAARRADECEADIHRLIESGHLDEAHPLISRLQAMTEQGARLDRIAARLSEARWQQTVRAEADAMLAEARELAAPPHPPARLKRALKLFDALLDRIGQGQYTHLENRFDLIKEERTQVADLLQQAQTLQSNLETAVAMGKLDDQIELIELYRRDLNVGHLDRSHVEAQIELLTTKIRQQMDATLEAHLDEVEAFMANPRNAEVALARLDENRDRWVHLSPPVLRRAEQRHRTLTEFVQRRRDVIARCREAQRLIEQGQHADAIVRLQIEATLHAELQIDVDQEMEIAVQSLARQVRRALDRVERDLDDEALHASELDELLVQAKEQVKALELVVGIVEDLDALEARAQEMVGRVRRLKQRLTRSDELLADVQSLMQEGRRAQAEALLNAFVDVPTQRRHAVAQQKSKLDMVIAAAEVVAELRRLIATDRPAAVEWAARHDQVPECRAYLAHARADDVFRAIQDLEAQGDYHAALGRAKEIEVDASPEMRAMVEREIRRLDQVEQHASQIGEILEMARAAQAEGRLDQVWTLFDAELYIGRAHRAEWHRLRTAAIIAAATRLSEVLARASETVRDALSRWLSESGLDDEPLYTGYGQDDARRLEARFHLDEALGQIDATRPLAESISERDKAVLPRDLLHRLDRFAVEALLCLIEDLLDRAEFDEARALIPDDASDSRLIRARARIERLAFSRRFARALDEFDRPTAERLIAEYRAPDSPEAIAARELVRSAQNALDLLAGTGDEQPPQEALTRQREALVELARLEARMPSSRGSLAGVRHRIEELLGRTTEAAFAAFDRDPLPGAVFLQYELLHRLLVVRELQVRPLLDLQEMVAERLGAGGEALLEWVRYQLSRSRRPEEIQAIEHRLGLMRRATFGDEEPDERFRESWETVRRAWLQANAQEDARIRRDELLQQALDALDLERLRDAAHLEGDGFVGDQRAMKMLPRWEAAHARISAIGEALSLRTFDEVERGLAELDALGTPHAAQVVFADPFHAGRTLPPGTIGVRAVLNEFRAAEERRRRERERAVEFARTRIDDLWQSIRQMASLSPMGGSSSELQHYVSARAPALLGTVTQLRAELEGLTTGSGTAERMADTVDTLVAQLPTADIEGIERLLTERCRDFARDFRELAAKTQTLDAALIDQREQIEAIGRRWPGVASIQRMVDTLSRAWRRRL